jgi:hypothetical protein
MVQSRPSSFLRAHEAATSSVDISALPSEGSPRTWRRLLRPKLVESTVLIIDLLLIVAAGVACRAVYHWATGGITGNLAPYIGVGVIAAANLSVTVTARRNYQLKRLIQFARQARETILIWAGIYGLLAAATFSSSDFSRSAVILFFAGISASRQVWD